MGKMQFTKINFMCESKDSNKKGKKMKKKFQQNRTYLQIRYLRKLCS